MFGNHVNQELSAYCHGEISPDRARLVAEHLLHCRRCREEYEEIRFGVHLAGHLREEKAPEGMWSELERELRSRDWGKGRQGDGAKSRWFGLSPFQVAAACATSILIIGFVTFGIYRRGQAPPMENRPSWEVTKIEGEPVIGREKIGATGRLAVGDWLVTDDSSRAQISVGQIGEVLVEPNSRISLLQMRDEEHRLALKRGKMEALIWAAPGKFYVDTPSAVAVDLGCSYTLEVNDDGVGILRVTSGWVAFEWEGRESFVPAQAMCITRPERGPGTPYFSDAAVALRSALERFDTAHPSDPGRLEALNLVLSKARRNDALTLWHLLTRTEENERPLVFDRLAKLIPPPAKVTREGILRGDRSMIDAWWDALELGDTEWWRLWKGPPPTQNNRQN